MKKVSSDQGHQKQGRQQQPQLPLEEWSVIFRFISGDVLYSILA
jgi:hypothetical protein